jgi:septum formation protein
MRRRLVLASASPRRSDLLRPLGLDLVVEASGIDEAPRPGEDGVAFARRAATEKAAAVARSRREDWVLGADTVVLSEGAVLGKPRDAAAACRMLERLSGRAHRVVTAVALFAPGAELAEAIAIESEVEFRRLAADEIRHYVATGEPLDKAGAYAIQGGASRFVARVAGSRSNVVGLPVEAVRDLLARHGVLDFGTAMRAAATTGDHA